MRYSGLLFLLPLIGLACLAGLISLTGLTGQISLSILPMDAQAQTWDNPYDIPDADSIIDASNGAVSAPVDPRFPSNPRSSRALQIGKTPDLSPMPSSLSTGGSNPKDSRAQAEASGSDTTNTSDTSTTTTATETPSSAGVDATPVDQTEASSNASIASNLGGTWSFELQDSSLKSMVLTLFQKEDAIFGTGQMDADNSTIIVTASGLVNGNKLNLDLVTLGTASLYRMTLDANGDSASGNYNAYSIISDPWTGTATGTRSVPQS